MTRHRLLASALAPLALLAAAGCRGGDHHADEVPAATRDEHEHEHDGHDDEHHRSAEREDPHEARRVRLTPGQIAYFGVSVVTVGPGTIDLGVRLPGEVRPNGDKLAHIVPRFPGIVRTVRYDAGARVRAGDVLAVIESDESLAPYELTTRIDGTIIEKHLTPGEAVDRATEGFVIADLSTVWVDLSVYQKDLPQLRVGQAVHVDGGPGLPEGTGVISYLTPIVDQPTRTATARLVLPNPDGAWRPGMFVGGHVLDPTPAALVVPRAAIQLIEREPVVFVETHDGFVPRPVTIGRAGETHVEILDGLHAGERLVGANSFLLKADLGKAEAAHEH